MKKFLKLLIGGALCSAFIFTSAAFAACDDDKEGDKGDGTQQGTQQGGTQQGGTQEGGANVYTLEAEAIDLSYVVGGNTSATPTGNDLITDYAAASGGKMVFSLYKKDLFVEFEFEADKADANATLSFVFMASFHDFSMTDNEVQIYVNPELDEDYYPVDQNTRIKYGELEISSTQLKEYTITQTMSIKQGTNTVYLYVNNTDSLYPTASTMNAKAPDIDCMKISTTSTITHTTYN